jgi:glyoxylase-like metal-dependent hydrolase (beta-lactamase superfamily II)
MEKLFDGVYMLQGEVGGRPLQLIYLKGQTASVLLDTGCASDPDKFILPQIRQAGGDSAQLTWIINTHSDLDHTGGNYEMKQVAPGALLACGDADREACASAAGMMRLRYDAYKERHHLTYTGDSRQWVIDQCGQPQPLDVTFTGGERLRLGADWEVEILSLPGHSKGHLGLLDRRNQALYAGDAIHGAVYLGFDSTEKLCPTYLHVDDYLSTIQWVEHLPITTYVGCHWPVKRGADIAHFCAESRQFVQKADLLLRELLAQPHTLKDICLSLGPQLGHWPRSADTELMYALNGHLERLVERGLARFEQTPGQPAVYQRV